MLRLATEQQFHTAKPLNHPENLKLAKELVEKFGIQKGVPCVKEINGEVTMRPFYQYLLLVVLDINDVLHISAEAYWLGGDEHVDTFDKEIYLVKIKMDNLAEILA